MTTLRQERKLIKGATLTRARKTSYRLSPRGKHPHNALPRPTLQMKQLQSPLLQPRSNSREEGRDKKDRNSRAARIKLGQCQRHRNRRQHPKSWQENEGPKRRFCQARALRRANQNQLAFTSVFMPTPSARLTTPKTSSKLKRTVTVCRKNKILCLLLEEIKVKRLVA